MKRTHTARIDGQEYRIERGDDGRVRVNGAAVDCDLLAAGDARFLRIGNHSYDVTSLRPDAENGGYTIRLNGVSLHVSVEDEHAALLNALGVEKATRLHSSTLRSPMPGKITRILVREGELIEAGQGVLILEAMKMENEIKAQAAGIVKAVRVSESEAVEKNAILIEIS